MKITFESFLYGMPSRDYIHQQADYDTQIQAAARKLKQADYVLIGAGAGMSTAAGAKYGGTFFEDHFAEFQERYGKGSYMQDMYSAGFYPYPDEESYWGYWSKQAMLGGICLDVTPLHKLLLNALKEKNLLSLVQMQTDSLKKQDYLQIRSSARRATTSIFSVPMHVTTSFTMLGSYLSRWIRHGTTARSQPIWFRNVRSVAALWI